MAVCIAIACPSRDWKGSVMHPDSVGCSQGFHIWYQHQYSQFILGCCPIHAVHIVGIALSCTDACLCTLCRYAMCLFDKQMAGCVNIHFLWSFLPDSVSLLLLKSALLFLCQIQSAYSRASQCACHLYILYTALSGWTAWACKTAAYPITCLVQELCLASC